MLFQKILIILVTSLKKEKLIFSPEDLKLVKEGPGERRKFLDRELSHNYPKYFNALVNYNKILSQRNRMLRDMKGKINDKLMLEIWNTKLCEYGAYIIEKRLEFIEELNGVCQSIHNKITLGKENLKLKYISNINIQC